MVAMARAAKEAFVREARVAEIDEADDADEEEAAAGEADEEAAAEGNARARRRAAGSWRSRDISKVKREAEGGERAFLSPRIRGKKVEEREKKTE